MGRDISKVKRLLCLRGQQQGGWDLFSRNLSILAQSLMGRHLGHPHLNLREER